MIFSALLRRNLVFLAKKRFVLRRISDILNCRSQFCLFLIELWYIFSANTQWFIANIFVWRLVLGKPNVYMVYIYAVYSETPFPIDQFRALFRVVVLALFLLRMCAVA